MRNKILLSILVLFWVNLVQISDVIAQINTPSGAVVPFGFNTNYGGNGILPTNLPTGGTYGGSTDAANAYNAWKTNYVVSCGGSPTQYRVKFDDPNKTVSEGVAYGMLLSAYAADQALFNGLYTYYLANKNGNGFMNWEINGCSGVASANGATDADEDAALALIIAKTQWPGAVSPYNYNTEATNLINKLKQFEVSSSSYQAINGDGWGFGSTCRNPSYQAPAYYRAFALQNPADAAFWNNAATAAYSLIQANANSGTGLVSDWCDNTGTTNSCNGSSPGTYGYDACRNPWRMSTDVIWWGTTTAASGLAQCNKIAGFINGKGAGNVSGPINQNGSGSGTHNATFVSTYAMGIVGAAASNQTILNQMYTQTVNSSDNVSGGYPSGYFGNTLRTLSLFVMTGNFWKPGSSSNQKIQVTLGGSSVASGSTYDFQNVQSTSNKTVTFTILNPGSKPLVLSGSPFVAVSGTNAAKFTVAQPASATINANTSETFTVTFTPGAIGAFTAMLTIASNDPATPSYTINLTGTGTTNATAPKIGVNKSGVVVANNSTYNWGNVTVNSTSYVTFTIRNTGDAPLNIDLVNTKLSSTTAGYSVSSSPPATIAVGSIGTFTLALAAGATVATKTVTYIIKSDDNVNGTFNINLTANAVTCATDITSSKVLQDFDANNNVTNPFNPKGTYSTTFVNNIVGPLDSSHTIASYLRRPVADGQYDVIRFAACGGGVYDFTNNTMISILVYSPAVGIPITLSPKTSAANPIIADYSSDAHATTTKAGAWERIYFDFSIIKNCTTAAFLDLMFDPTNNTGANEQFYFDNIQYDVAPCIADLPASGIFDDYENHRNVSLVYANGTLNETFANPSATGINTSTTVAKYVRPGASKYQGFRYSGCQNKISLSGKTLISMQVYSGSAGIPITMSLKTSGGVAVKDVTMKTTKVNTWETIYYDFSSVAGNTTVAYMDILPDTGIAFTSSLTYYFDLIQYDVPACTAGITASGGILQDYDNNRWLNLAQNPAGSFNDFLANPHSVAPNTSATVAQYVRPATGTYQTIRYSGCTGTFDLSAGRTVFSLNIWSPQAGVPVIMSFKKADGTTSLSSITATTSITGAWETLYFDQTIIRDSTSAAFMDIMIDPLAAFVGTVASRTYDIDNIRYAAPAPYMNVKVGSNYQAPASNVNFGSVAVGSSSAVFTFIVQNNGTQDLTLSGVPKIAISGTDASSFVVNQTVTSATVGAASTTTFTVTFTPVSGGAKAATLSIANNDARTGFNPYIIYLNGTGVAPIMAVSQGATVITSGTGSYSFGSIATGSSSAAITFTVANTGNDTLRLSGIPKITIAGTNAADFTINQAATIAKVNPLTGTTTFTITFTPGATGARTATISITNNDQARNPYTFTVTGTGTCTLPSAAGTITGVANPCSGSTGNTYSIAAVTGATGYTWTVPTGATITAGTGTTGITVTMGSTTGNVTVTPTNTCGNGTAATKAVTINTVPSAAGAISGAASPCSGATGVTYSITAVTGATGYNWIVPAGSTITAGTGSTSITVTIGTTAGNVTVTPTNACGNGTAAIKAITISGAANPAGAITGTSSVCSGTTGVTYSIAAVTGATGYTWTVPAGATVTAGAGTTGITVTFGTASGNVTVTPTSACGSGASANLAVTVNPAASAAGAISDPGAVCISATGIPFSISVVTGATGYTWTVPAGATIASGQGTSSITVNFGTTPGSVSVTPTSTCGNGASANLSVMMVNGPGAAGSISGPASVCSGATGKIYSIAAVTGASGYNWTIPAGAAITSGANTTSITVTWGSIAGSVSVVPTGTCGNGASSNLSVSILTSGCTIPSSQTITGPSSVNANQTGVTFSVNPPAAGSTYTWSLPLGAVITSASPDSSSITVTFGTTGGNVALTETNAAGSTTSTLPVTINTPTGIATGTGSDSYVNYPSPFSDETMVKINSSVSTQLSVKVSDLKGNLIYESDEFYTNEDIKLGKGFAAGLYMVQISYGSKIQIIKIVKL